MDQIFKKERYSIVLFYLKIGDFKDRQMSDKKLHFYKNATTIDNPWGPLLNL